MRVSPSLIYLRGSLCGTVRDIIPEGGELVHFESIDILLRSVLVRGVWYDNCSVVSFKL